MLEAKEKKTVKEYVLGIVEIIGTGGLSVLKADRKSRENNGQAPRDKEEGVSSGSKVFGG